MKRLATTTLIASLALPAYADIYMPPGGGGGGGSGNTTINGVSCALNGSCTVGVALGDITGAGLNVLTTLAAAVNAVGGVVSPAPTRAGDIIYWNGSTWVTLAGNNSGTTVLQETAAGVPSWVSVGASGVSSITTTCPAVGPSTGAVTIPNGVGVVAKSANYSVVVGDCGTLFQVTGTNTQTLPALGTIAAGFTVTEFNAGSGTTTIASNGALSNINANGSVGASVTLAAGQSMTLIANSAVNGWNGLAQPASGGPHTVNVITVSKASSPFTYTPTSGIVRDQVLCIGGGGAGGSGGVATGSTAMSGGGGGGGAASMSGWFTAAQIGVSLTVTIGAGGTGGTAPAIGTPANGGNGSAGGDSTFGTLLTAFHGGGGAGAQSAANSGGGGSAGVAAGGGSSTGTGAGSAGTAGGVAGGAGGAGSNNLVAQFFGGGGAGGVAAGTAGLGGGTGPVSAGGGSGGGLTAVPAASSGGGGNNAYGATNAVNFGTAGTAGVAGGPGTLLGTVVGSSFVGGGSGGGGGSSITGATAGGAGGLGALGSGGGGGGTTTAANSATAGAGGAGGDGQCTIVEYF